MAALRVVMLMVAVLLAGGAAAQAPVEFGRSRIEVVSAAGARRAMDVEMATTPDQLRQGLMYRRSLAADAGMLFDFGSDQPVSMWMKNTLIPLDMVFIAGDGRVVGITERAVPQSLAIISSPGPVRAVLEINGGAAARLGIHAGDHILNPIFRQ